MTRGTAVICRSCCRGHLNAPSPLREQPNYMILGARGMLGRVLRALLDQRGLRSGSICPSST